MFIEQPSKWLRWLYPHALWRMDEANRAVYLTFDDGPIPEATPFILDTLKEYGVKATFFVVGDNVWKYPELFDRIVAEGHRIGNHTYNHWGSKHTLQHYVQNVKKCQKIIDERLHANPHYQSAMPHLMRPPHGWMRYGAYVWLRFTYTIVMWDLVTRDYSNRLNAYDVFYNVRRYARNGSIITFHDSLKSIDKLKTALPQSLQWLKEQGYEFGLIHNS